MITLTIFIVVMVYFLDDMVFGVAKGNGCAMTTVVGDGTRFWVSKHGNFATNVVVVIVLERQLLHFIYDGRLLFTNDLRGDNGCFNFSIFIEFRTT